MKTEIGGGRIGSGNKMQTSMKYYRRSTHDLSSTWRSTMAAGTLVPFMSLPALPGDTWDIELAADIVTKPTVGPLFGSFKMQMDVFQIPMRIYNSMLHMNRVGVGNDMSSVLLPRIQLFFEKIDTTTVEDIQVNNSALMKYLGVSGLYNVVTENNGDYVRSFNAVSYLGYFDIVKNFYANQQEERFFVIHTDDNTIGQGQRITSAIIFIDDIYNGSCLDLEITADTLGTTVTMEVALQTGALEPSAAAMAAIPIDIEGAGTTLGAIFSSLVWDATGPVGIIQCSGWTGATTDDTTFEITGPVYVEPIDGWDLQPKLLEIPLTNIDDMRMKILQHTPQTSAFVVGNQGIAPYNHERLKYEPAGADKATFSVAFPQENLALKTYQSDLFNNWINTDWLDGPNGVNDVTAVDTTGNSFTIDALNLAKKVYVMLNRIAISGGTYDDWLDAVYEHERPKSMEEPIYHGSLIKEIAFEEVISNAATDVGGNEQPLGELGGRGRLTDKHKGGKMKIKIHEPSYLMGIVSITPRIEYSQGNTYDMNFNTMDDIHKPALDAIGFQELITDQMSYLDTNYTPGTITDFQSVGKLPAWINWMTDVNRSYGNFAAGDIDDYMVLNRNYTINANGGIDDLTTYIDPIKSNYIFSQIDRSAMNFQVHIGKKITARRLMSAKVIPNL